MAEEAAEKDQVIKDLRAEGEKLSKQQLTLNNIIKKLRATEKDNQKVISSLKYVYILDYILLWFNYIMGLKYHNSVKNEDEEILRLEYCSKIDFLVPVLIKQFP